MLRIFAFIALTAFSTAARADDRPSFLVIMADDMSYTEFTRAIMPKTFARLVDQGARFMNFQVNTPVCGPSRATMHTGRYPHNHGFKQCTDEASGNMSELWDVYHRGGNSARETGPRLNAFGYYSAMAGKSHSTIGAASVMIAAGVDRYYSPPGWDDFLAPIVVTYWDAPAIDNGQSATIPGYVPHALRDRAIAAIDAAVAAGKPFYVALWPTNPHTDARGGAMYPPEVATLWSKKRTPRSPDFNAAPTGKHPEIEALWAEPMTAGQVAKMDAAHRDRARSLRALDADIAALLDKVDQTGRAASTYVILTSDNGYKTGHFRLKYKSSPWARDTNVPFVVRGPGVAVGIRNEPIGMVDVAPTILELAGVAIPDDVDGRSFAAVLAGGPPLVRAPVFAQHWQRTVVAFKPGAAIRWRWRAIVDRRWRYVRWDDGFEEYYDTFADRFELTNIAGTLTPQRLGQLRRMIDARAGCYGATC